MHFPILYHLSFRDNLEGRWIPRNPDGTALESIDISEPDLPRISVSTDITKCFQAIYANVFHYFENDHYPYIDFFVYSPVLTGKEEILTPEQLRKKRMIHDTHITDEYCILDPVQMNLMMKVRIFNTNKSPKLKYHPYGDRRTQEWNLAPRDVKHEVLKVYRRIATESLPRRQPAFW